MTENPEFEKSLSVLRTCLFVVGVDIFGDDWRPNIWSYTTILILVSYPMMAVHFIMHHVDSTEFLTESVSAAISIADMAFSVLEFIRNRKEWFGIIKSTQECALLFDGKKFTQLFYEYFHRNYVFVNIYYSVCAITASVYAIISFMRPDPRKFGLPLPLIFPFMDAQSELFHSLNVIYQYGIIIFSAHIAVAQFAAIIVGITAACCQLDAFKITIRNFNSLIAEPDTTQESLKTALIEIVRLHAVIRAYISRIQRKFAIMYLAMIFTCGIVVAMCLNVAAGNIVSSSSCLMLVAFASIMINCYCGIYLIAVNEDLVATIYDIDWYELSVPNRKLFKFFLANAQTPAALHGYLMPLNMATFVKVSKQSQYNVKLSSKVFIHRL
ncbi:uncharacterized protein LOC129738396 [Uranotaenia lowii]|uniref:uncharacterized protein LOC129738396 n=1 Tax=Uranotaenia lowii TaxID=190385 RepID=UPI002479BBEA|nr:uncharacterized protein LOC129738396 [Uranotaenia lowii]